MKVAMIEKEELEALLLILVEVVLPKEVTLVEVALLQRREVILPVEATPKKELENIVDLEVQKEAILEVEVEAIIKRADLLQQSPWESTADLQIEMQEMMLPWEEQADLLPTDRDLEAEIILVIEMPH